jgi:signal peptidase I
MKGRIFSFLKKVGVILLALFIVSLIFLAYGHINNRWYKLVYIKSDSMKPVFQAGDLICITKPPYEIKPGMIICFQIKEDIVTHRVMAINEDGSFETKGDANEISDDWDNYQIKKIAGIYRFKIPYLGYPIGYSSYWIKKAIGKIGKVFIGSSAYFANQDKILAGITAENPPKGENPNSKGEEQDEAENQSSEDKAPTIETFNINNDESTTESLDVILTISASDDITPSEKLQMRIANDEETWSDENTGWEVYSTNKEWQLSEEEGEKRAFLQVKDEAGNITSSSDTINYELPVDNEDFEDNGNVEETEEKTTEEET